MRYPVVSLARKVIVEKLGLDQRSGEAVEEATVLQSGAFNRKATMRMTIWSGASLPASMYEAIQRDKAVSWAFASRSISPVDRCGMPSN